MKIEDDGELLYEQSSFDALAKSLNPEIEYWQ